MKAGSMKVQAGLAALLIASLATPILAAPQSPGIDRREHRQKQRIREGIKSGQVTRDEAKVLRQEQREIRAKERAMKSDGVLTGTERKELHRDLNGASRQIYQEKHDAETR